MDSGPWAPAGPPINIPLAQTPTPGVQTPNPAAGPQVSFRMVNMSASYTHVGFGQTAAVAQASCIAIPDGVTANQVVLLPNSEKTFLLAPATYFSAMTESGTGNLQIAQGYGGT